MNINFKKWDNYLNNLVEDLEKFGSKGHENLVLKERKGVLFLTTEGKRNFLIRLIEYIYKPKNKRINVISKFALDIIENNKDYFKNHPTKVSLFHSTIVKNPLLTRKWTVLKSEFENNHTSIKEQTIAEGNQERNRIIKEAQNQRDQILQTAYAEKDYFVHQAEKTKQAIQTEIDNKKGELADIEDGFQDQKNNHISQMAKVKKDIDIEIYQKGQELARFEKDFHNQLEMAIQSVEKECQKVRLQKEGELKEVLQELSDQIEDRKTIFYQYMTQVLEFQDTIIKCRSDENSQEESYVYSTVYILKRSEFFRGRLENQMEKQAFDLESFQQKLPRLKYSFDFSDYSKKVVEAMIKFTENPDYEINFEIKDLIELYQLADFLIDEKLKEECLNQMHLNCPSYSYGLYLPGFKDALLILKELEYLLPIEHSIIQLACQEVAADLDDIEENQLEKISKNHLIEILKQSNQKNEFHFVKKIINCVKAQPDLTAKQLKKELKEVFYEGEKGNRLIDFIDYRDLTNEEKNILLNQIDLEEEELILWRDYNNHKKTIRF